MKHPLIGRWISGNESPSVMVSEILSVEEDDSFYLVVANVDGDPCGPLELDPDEWERFVSSGQLAKES